MAATSHGNSMAWGHHAMIPQLHRGKSNVSSTDFFSSGHQYLPASSPLGTPASAHQSGPVKWNMCMAVPPNFWHCTELMTVQHTLQCCARGLFINSVVEGWKMAGTTAAKRMGCQVLLQLLHLPPARFLHSCLSDFGDKRSLPW